MENHDRMYGDSEGDSSNSGTLELMFQKLNDISQRISIIEARLPTTSDTAAAKCGSDNKDPLPLSVKKDFFDVICKEKIEDSLLTKTWSELDPPLKKRTIQSIVDQLKIKDVMK
ncbi:uncharacterized protein [Dysidea avara]|uniref:uncharacterized protein n=1 Tax=Dysidea avara TaxID=196820 RepID=UPI00331B7774